MCKSFRKNFIEKFVEKKNKKATKFAIFLIFHHEIIHPFREQICNIRKKIFAKFRNFAKVFARWKPYTHIVWEKKQREKTERKRNVMTATNLMNLTIWKMFSRLQLVISCCLIVSTHNLTEHETDTLSQIHSDKHNERECFGNRLSKDR